MARVWVWILSIDTVPAPGSLLLGIYCMYKIKFKIKEKTENNQETVHVTAKCLFTLLRLYEFAFSVADTTIIGQQVLQELTEIGIWYAFIYIHICIYIFIA
jgi:hypothetical protein